MNLIEAFKALEEGKKVRKKGEKEYYCYQNGKFAKSECYMGHWILEPREIEIRNFDEIYNEDLWEEVKEPVLDNDERTYLSNLIAPFKQRILHITKASGSNEKYAYIKIALAGLRYEYIELPIFNTKDMYKGMELNRAYTLRELDLL